MKFTPTHLHDRTRFTKLVEIEISNLLPFIKEYAGKKSALVIAFNLFLMLLAAVAIACAVKHGVTGGWGWSIASVGWAVIFSFPVLIPIHEVIHGMTYKFFGATDVRYSASLRQFMFFASAHNFVADNRAFAWVAVMPFLVINTALAAFAIVSDGSYQIFALSALVIHTVCCSGDMALLNYMWLHRRQKLYTYDDMDARKIYIYAEHSEATATI